ncbi:MAG: TRAP transporter large permease [Desulfocapsaceae bacterium]|nr:TRAP transporter large permease [Desulfocapsaceae bacterium]
MLTILISCFIIGLLIGLPIVFVMGISAACVMLVSEPMAFILIPQQFFAGINSTTLTAIPFFILAAELMGAGELTPALLRFAKSLVGHIKGGLGYSSILTSVMFAGISGSALADAAGPGVIDRQMMKKDGYSPEYASAISCANAVVGPIIPPSILAIIYATTDSRVTVGGLFMAGVLPGLLLALAVAAANYFLVRKHGYTKVRQRKKLLEILKLSIKASPALMMPVIILVGIRGGIFTPTEGAAVAAAYAMFVGFFITRKLSLAILPKVMLRAALATAAVLLIVSMATLFANVLTTMRLPDMLAKSAAELTDSRLIALFILAGIVLVTGLFIDTLPALIILAPVLSPVAAAFGVDPIQFAVMMILNLAIGMVTPPVGPVLFLVSSMERVKLEKIIVSIAPILVAQFFVLLLIVLFPSISTVLPHALGFTN